MRPGRAVTLVWSLVILGLVALELAELTHLFTLPLVHTVLTEPLTLVFSLVFTSILAIVGAIFIGIYISTRLLRPTGFTPFEEEMLRMRTELQQLARSVEELRRTTSPPEPSKESPGERTP